VSGDAMLSSPPGVAALKSIGVRSDETRVVAADEVWWRIHRTEGPTVLQWNEFRSFGPALRFDPHRLPRGHDRDRAIWYGASTPGAALAEAFQADRTIDRHRRGPYLTGLSFTRTLTVLDMATDSPGAWITRAGGNFAVSTAPHAVTQQWARGVVAAFPDLDGLRYNSRFAVEPCLALFTPARSAMPSRPVISLPLAHPDLTSRLAGAAKRLGYRVV
jgi:hypothetical protein